MKEAEVHIYILPLMTAVEVITYVEIDHTTLLPLLFLNRNSQHVLTSIFLT